MTRVALALACLSALAPAARAEPAGELARFALVVGYNRPPRPELPTLRYADDDAVRWSVLLGTYGARVELLTELDDESRRLYAEATPPLAAPTTAALKAAMVRLREAMLAARAAGRRTVFYFVYAGHGDADEAGEGYVTLADGRLSRHDFESTVLAGAPADASHVVIDACRSYLFVYDRGPGGTRRPFNQRYFASGTAARFPRTGFLLSSSSGAPSHEWEEFQAGVFSHEVRSALLGAADADGDARVSYRELEGFLEVANQAVRNERYRPSFVVSAPLEGDGILLDTAGARGGEVTLPPAADGRQLLEDPLGVRWADLHPSAHQAVTLRMPAPPWAPPQFFLRRLSDEQELRVPAGRRVSAASLSRERARTLRRGAAHEAFTQLFSVPFDGAAVARAHPVVEAQVAQGRSPPAPALRRAGWATAGAGVLALGAAAVLLGHAYSLRDEGASGEERQRLNQRIQRDDRWAAVSAVGGVALAATGAVLLLAGREAPARTGLSLRPAIAVGPEGVFASLAFAR